jgi:hypothetical protein
MDQLSLHRWGELMKPQKKIKIERPKREKLTHEETLKRMKSFPKRREKFIAAISEGTH